MTQRRSRGEQTRGQSTIEYAVLLAIVISAFLVIQIFVKRAAMGRMRSVTDQQLGRQWDPFNVSGTTSTTTTTHESQTLSTSGDSLTTITGAGELSKREADEKVKGIDPAAGGTNLFGSGP